MIRITLPIAATTLVLGLLLASPLAMAQEAQAEPAAEYEAPKTEDGWIDLPKLLVPSDGSRVALAPQRGRRDAGSKIVFFDTEKGDNETADIYWWDGKRIVDSAGKPANDAGQAYGTNPLEPNEEAIKAFAHLVSDPRLVDTKGNADWFLFRRGRVHETFETSKVFKVDLEGGRSQSEPMVVAAYGPLGEGRAIMERAPFNFNSKGKSLVVHFHLVFHGLELHQGIRYLGTARHEVSSPGEPGVPTWLIEDCRLVRAQMNYMPSGTTVRKSVSAFNWKAQGHNQGYWNTGYHVRPTFDEVIFYKNGFKQDPRTHADPRRTIFDRNIYQGGGGQMGHTYRNIIDATGGSGSPQMRYGGLMENSLIIEGYWYSATHGTIHKQHGPQNSWLVEGKQQGRSAVVRNNVNLIYQYPSPNDPDTNKGAKSSRQAQFGTGYMLMGASFGAQIENNIVSSALLVNDLGFRNFTGRFGFSMSTSPMEYGDGKTYTQQRNTFRGNIAYRTKVGFQLGGDWTGASGHVIENNVFAAERGLGAGKLEDGLESTDQLVFRSNRIYAEEKTLPKAPWVGPGNTVRDYSEAAQKEGWPDPDRTLRRYVTEVLKLELLDWSDDPWLPDEEVAPRVAAGEAYDPMGLKTFMAVATNMRRGGKDAIPATGKPSWKGDYPWDARFTGVSVVNWIREGFGLPPVSSEIKSGLHDDNQQKQ